MLRSTSTLCWRSGDGGDGDGGGDGGEGTGEPRDREGGLGSNTRRSRLGLSLETCKNICSTQWLSSPSGDSRGGFNMAESSREVWSNLEATGTYMTSFTRPAAAQTAGISCLGAPTTTAAVRYIGRVIALWIRARLCVPRVVDERCHGIKMAGAQMYCANVLVASDTVLLSSVNLIVESSICCYQFVQ